MVTLTALVTWFEETKCHLKCDSKENTPIRGWSQSKLPGLSQVWQEFYANVLFLQWQAFLQSCRDWTVAIWHWIGGIWEFTKAQFLVDWSWTQTGTFYWSLFQPAASLNDCSAGSWILSYYWTKESVHSVGEWPDYGQIYRQFTWDCLFYGWICLQGRFSTIYGGWRITSHQ